MSTSSDTTTGARTRLVRIVITKDKMSAMMALGKPPQNVPPATMDDVKEELKRVGLVHGIDWDAIEQALDSEVYETPVKIATGTQPKRGRDSTFEYAFETEKQHSPEESEDGRIDYRSINFIQNVREGTALIRKTPPTDGENGKGVDGKIIPGIRGRDFPFSQGANTVVSENGLELRAATNGAIVFTRSGVSVNDVTTINGDVDMSVGNIECIGSVRVAGQIQPGFELAVGGNLEVNGNVADSTIRCEGNILVRGGCFGKGEGIIRADGDVVVKYAEGLKLHAGNDILVGEELHNCRAIAGERVLVKSKKGKIVGGEVNAGKEIRVAIAGTDAGTKTVLRVGYDADLMGRYKTTVKEVQRIERDAERVKTTMVGLYKLQMNGGLDDQKKAVLSQLEEFQKTAPGELKRLKEEQAQLEEQLAEIADASIICEKTLHAGVIAYFGMVYREFTESHQRCKLTMDDGRVVLSESRPEKT